MATPPEHVVCDCPCTECVVGHCPSCAAISATADPNEPAPQARARCGGPGLCRQCSRDAAKHTRTPEHVHSFAAGPSGVACPCGAQVVNFARSNEAPGGYAWEIAASLHGLAEDDLTGLRHDPPMPATDHQDPHFDRGRCVCVHPCCVTRMDVPGEGDAPVCTCPAGCNCDDGVHPPCWCKPGEACHADVLLAIANTMEVTP